MDWTALLAAYFGGSKKPSDMPQMTSASPAQSDVFDSSGWIMNYGGNQVATSSPSITAPVSTMPGLPSLAGLLPGLSGGFAAGQPVNNATVTAGASASSKTMLLLIGAVGLVALWKFSR